MPKASLEENCTCRVLFFLSPHHCQALFPVDWSLLCLSHVPGHTLFYSSLHSSVPALEGQLCRSSFHVFCDPGHASNPSGCPSQDSQLLGGWTQKADESSITFSLQPVPFWLFTMPVSMSFSCSVANKIPEEVVYYLLDSLLSLGWPKWVLSIRKHTLLKSMFTFRRTLSTLIFALGDILLAHSWSLLKADANKSTSEVRAKPFPLGFSRSEVDGYSGADLDFWLHEASLHFRELVERIAAFSTSITGLDSLHFSSPSMLSCNSTSPGSPHTF